MKKKISLSFKKHPRETGLRAVGAGSPHVDIKINKKRVGYISSPKWDSPDNRYKIHYAVTKKDIMEDGNPNCTWRWIHLKLDYETEELARLSVKGNYRSVVERYDLHSFDE